MGKRMPLVCKVRVKTKLKRRFKSSYHVTDTPENICVKHEDKQGCWRTT